MSNNEIGKIMNDVYNVWWRKWAAKAIPLHDASTWQQMVSEMCALLDKYNREPLVVDMVNDLADELERRARQQDKEGGIENAKL